MEDQEKHKYDDILYAARPVSTRHARMSLSDRAAQFAPYAALVGFDSVIRETARLTDSETMLDEGGKELLDRKLRYIADHLEELSDITFLCFVPDDRKAGGSYVPVAGKVKKIDLYRNTVLLEDGQEFLIESIRAIDGVE